MDDFEIDVQAQKRTRRAMYSLLNFLTFGN